jgi:hypothetical protein
MKCCFVLRLVDREAKKEKNQTREMAWVLSCSSIEGTERGSATWWLEQGPMASWFLD